MKKVKGSALLGTILMITAITLVYFTATKILMDQNKISMKESNINKAEEMADLGLKEGLAKVKVNYSLPDCQMDSDSVLNCWEYGDKDLNGVIKGPMMMGYNSSCDGSLLESRLSNNTTIKKECPYYLLAIRDAVVVKSGDEFQIAKQLQVAGNLKLPIRSGSDAKVYVDGNECLSTGDISCTYDRKGILVNFNSGSSLQKKVLTVRNMGRTDLEIGKGYLTIDVIGYGNKNEGESFIQKQTDVFGVFNGKTYAELVFNTHKTTDSMLSRYNLPER